MNSIIQSRRQLLFSVWPLSGPGSPLSQLKWSVCASYLWNRAPGGRARVPTFDMHVGVYLVNFIYHLYHHYHYHRVGMCGYSMCRSRVNVKWLKLNIFIYISISIYSNIHICVYVFMEAQTKWPKTKRTNRPKLQMSQGQYSPRHKTTHSAIISSCIRLVPHSLKGNKTRIRHKTINKVYIHK